MVIHLPLRLESVANLREHWAPKARRAAQERLVCRLAVQSGLRRDALEPPYEVKIVRVGPRKLDSDNLASACKAVRDGVADAIGIDDGDERIRWGYGQQKGKEYSITITIRSSNA